jgi:hypothetical protein
LPCATALESDVARFKYLGHSVDNNNMDDDDVQREINNLYARTNILLYKFAMFCEC